MIEICAGLSTRFKLPTMDFRGTPVGVDVRNVAEIRHHPEGEHGRAARQRRHRPDRRRRCHRAGRVLRRGHARPGLETVLTGALLEPYRPGPAPARPLPLEGYPTAQFNTSCCTVVARSRRWRNSLRVQHIHCDSRWLPPPAAASGASSVTTLWIDASQGAAGDMPLAALRCWLGSTSNRCRLRSPTCAGMACARCTPYCSPLHRLRQFAN